MDAALLSHKVHDRGGHEMSHRFTYACMGVQSQLHGPHRETARVQVAPLLLERPVTPSTLHDIFSEFSAEDDAIGKVQLLIKYACMLPRMAVSDKTAANRVTGCTTQVRITM